MNSKHFDNLTRSMSGATSRRAAIGLAAALGLGAVIPSEAKKHKKKKKHKTSPPATCQVECGNKVCGPSNCPDQNCGACGQGLLCQNGACVQCLQRSDCPADTVCATWNCNAGACVSTPAAANGTSCGANQQQCNSGECLERPTCLHFADPCSDDADCCSGVCPGGNVTCQLSETGEPCRLDGHCVSNHCVGYRCA